MRIRVGTRGSPLALAQTETALRRLRALHPGDTFTTEVIQSSADRSTEAPLASMPRGVFAKELEAALADDAIDIAVHSFKDLPIEASPGCVVAAVTERADPRDALVAPGRKSLADIPAKGRIGTSSPRRKALLHALRPDLDVAPVRGNVGTRVGKAGTGGLDGVVVAAAGLARLGMLDAACEVFDPASFVPEAGQGVLALQIRDGDGAMERLVEAANDADSWTAVTAEGTAVRALGGGCTVPVAAYARVEGDHITMYGIVSDGGTRLVRAETDGKRAGPEAVGAELARRLSEAGAADILAEPS